MDKSESDLEHRRIRVLVADDEPLVVDVLKALVGSDPSLDFIGAANDAEQAIDLAVKERPDVMLLDVRMPGGGGLRAAREISQRCGRTKIVALSAHEDADTVIGMIAAGAHGYVPKGDPTDKILRTIHRAAHGRRASRHQGQPDLMVVGSATARRDGRAAEVARAIIDGAVTAEYAPIVDVTTMRTVGLEVRPRLATLPHRSYDAWCADAQTVGLLPDLELTAFRQATQVLRKLPEEMFLAFEVSPLTAGEARFRRSLKKSLMSRIVFGFSPLVGSGDVRIDDVNFAEKLEGLRARGIRIAAMDSGSGLEGLGHLRTLAPEFVRLDEPLIRSVETSFINHSVVAAVVAYAGQVGARVIASGVDSEAQIEEIRCLGVHLAQGDHVGEPFPVSGLPAHVTDWLVDPSSGLASEPISHGKPVSPTSSSS